MNEKHHEMIFKKIHISGLEEWYCPICGRRFLVQWLPAYMMIILAAGDKIIRHNVSKSNSLKQPTSPMNFDYSPGLSGWRKSISTANGIKRWANLMCQFSVLGKKYCLAVRRIPAW